MTNRPSLTTAAKLRRRAEAHLRQQEKSAPTPSSHEDLQRLLHELQVHQIELEMQNDELRNARQQAEESAAQYRNLYDFAPISYVTLDAGGVITRLNLCAAILLGGERAKLQGQRFATFIHESARPTFARFMMSVSSAHQEQDFEGTLGGVSGPCLTVQIRALWLPDQQECKLVLMDITERKRINEELRASERLYRAIGESLDFGVWVCDPQGRNTYASPSFLKLLGFTQQQCSDLGWGSALHPDEGKATIEAWQHCVKNGDRWYREHRFRGTDGQWHPVLACGVRVRDDQGATTAWAGITLDISRLKQAEYERSRTIEDLSRSNKDLAQFAYVASHDLKEPLRMVTVFLELLQFRSADSLDAKSKEYITIAVTSASRLKSLVDDLLAYSSAGRISKAETINTTTAVQQALVNLKASIEESGAVCTCDPLPTVVANPPELTQLFENLIGNAIKYRRPGIAPEIHIGARRMSEVEGRAQDAEQSREGSSPGRAVISIPDPQPAVWLFAIRDNGIGIDPQFNSKIFVLFQRLHTREKYSGTGVGLALCKKIVETYGGRIWVESQPNQGATFYFTFPETQSGPEAATGKG